MHAVKSPKNSLRHWLTVVARAFEIPTVVRMKDDDVGLYPHITQLS